MKRFIGDAKKRRIYSELLNNKRWLLLRKAKLNETGGLCERCLSEGRFVSASVVHHVVPVEWGVGRFGMEKGSGIPAGSIRARTRTAFGS